MLKRLIGLAALFILALSACTGGGDLEVSNARANLTLPSDTGTVYLTITNNTSRDETLLGAAIPGCTNTEIHEMAMEDGVMRMSRVEGGSIVIPAGETLVLEPGGLHIMCLGKTGNFQVERTVKVNLAFKNAGSMTLDVEVIAP